MESWFEDDSAKGRGKRGRYVPVLWWVQDMGQTAELRNLRHVALVVAPGHCRTRSALVNCWSLSRHLDHYTQAHQDHEPSGKGRSNTQ